MYSKQRKKTNYDDLDEEDLLYGTPFPALEDGQNATNPKKQQELDQTVRDEQGRRRLHGAFTGGWSAGYFNSVNTKEGWTPSQFISKKNDRTKRRDFKPEDFMDDEDFSEYGIAPKQVKAKDEFFSTTESFAGFRHSVVQQSSTIDDVIKGVITLKSTSIGIQILKKMKKNAIQRLSKDDYVNSDKIFPLEFDEDDLKNFFMNPKKNLNGIGYKGLTTNVNFSTGTRLEQSNKSEFSTLMKDGKKLKITGEAFGYGALDDEDGDDFEAEIYTFDDLSKYDYSVGGKRQSGKSDNLLNSILSDSHLMDDFRKSTEHRIDQLNENKITVPINWKPRPPIQASIIKKRKSRWDSDDKSGDKIEENKDDQTKYKKLNSIKRAEILGESSTLTLEQEEIELKLNNKEEQKTISSSSDQIEKIERFKKPLTGFFAQKFVQSTNTPLDEYKPGLTDMESVLSHLSKRSKNEIEEKETKTLVGKSNRETYQFHPHELVCKRFNVPHPYPQFPDVVGVLAMNKTKKDPNTFFPTSIASQLSHSSQKTEKTKIIKEPVEEKIEEFKRPDMNLFKAVFDLSDDDDEVDISDIEEIENETENNQNLSSNDQTKVIESSKPSNSSLNDNLIGNDPPKILFNKAFIKKDTSKEIESENVKQTACKVALDLFENDLDSDEEIKEFELKKKPNQLNKLAINKSLELNSIKKVLTKNEFIKEIVISDKEDDHLPRQDLTPANEFKRIDSSKLREKLKSKKDSDKEIESDNESDVDHFIDEIMKSDDLHETSHPKKKRKKHKEHKKHKKKKHKSDKDNRSN